MVSLRRLRFKHFPPAALAFSFCNIVVVVLVSSWLALTNKLGGIRAPPSQTSAPTVSHIKKSSVEEKNNSLVVSEDKVQRRLAAEWDVQSNATGRCRQQTFWRVIIGKGTGVPTVTVWQQHESEAAKWIPPSCISLFTFIQLRNVKIQLSISSFLICGGADWLQGAGQKASGTWSAQRAWIWNEWQWHQLAADTST